MQSESKFEKDLKTAQRLLSKAQQSLAKINSCIERKNISNAIEESYNYEILCERIVNNARILPVSSGIPSVKGVVVDNIIKENNVLVEYTNENWFHINFPSLLPKKEKGDPSYIRATVQSALKKFFLDNKKRTLQDDSIIIFQHNYNKSRPEREFRDHDNIEINAIVDLVALYLLVDDSPMKCKHFYCSKVSDHDSTDVFLIPTSDFVVWLKANNI